MNNCLHARRLVALVALILGAIAVSGCIPGTGGSDTKAKKPAGAARDGSGAVDGALQFADARLRNLLLPAGAVPLGLKPDQDYLLPNEEVAKFFPDQEAALRAMADAGRMQGAAVDFRLRSATPRASEEAVAVSSSVAWYKTVAGAQAVIKDPAMELVIHRFGLHTAEISLDAKIGQESRVFRGFRDGDGPDLAAYLLLFRRENLIGAVVVVVPAATDDGGKLALSLAKRQADVSLSSAAQR